MQLIFMVKFNNVGKLSYSTPYKILTGRTDNKEEM